MGGHSCRQSVILQHPRTAVIAYAVLHAGSGENSPLVTPYTDLCCYCHHLLAWLSMHTTPFCPNDRMEIGTVISTPLLEDSKTGT